MRPASPSFTLVAPGLLAQAAKAPRLPALETLLARANARTAPSVYSALIARLCDFPGARLPAATWMRLGEGLAADERLWLCADPVHLFPERDRVRIVPVPPLSAEEAASLTATLEAHFAPDGWHFDSSRSGRLFVRMDEEPGLALPATSEIIGRTLSEVLPHDRAHLHWLARLNEIQMLLYMHPVNAAREAGGVLSANGLWLWGAGHLPTPWRTSWENLYADDPLVRGLAMNAAIPVTALPRGVEELKQDGRRLAVLPEDAALSDIEQGWASPLLAQLRAGALRELTVYAGESRAFHITAVSVHRFWRRRKPLAHYLP